MDLSTLDTVAAASEGAVMAVLHPVTHVPLKTEAGEPITVTCLGVDSSAFRARQKALINKRLHAGRKVKPTAEEIEEEGMDALASCVTGWSNIVLDKKALDCTPSNVKAVFSRLPWLKEQVDEFVGDRGNFLKVSQAS